VERPRGQATCPRFASRSASTQKSVSMVIDSRHARSRRLNQVHHRHQINKPLGHRNVRNVRAPHLVRPVDA
jgi:hypothetical protein